MKDGLQAQLASIKEFFDRSTRALDESDSTFAPKEGMFTTAQQVAHAAQTIDWFIQGAFAPGGFSMDFENMEKEIRAVTSLKAARVWMDKACAGAKTSIDAHSDADWGAPLPPGPVMGGMPRFLIFGAISDHTAHRSEEHTSELQSRLHLVC